MILRQIQKLDRNLRNLSNYPLMFFFGKKSAPAPEPAPLQQVPTTTVTPMAQPSPVSSFSPPALRNLKYKTQRLKRQLRVTERSLGRPRVSSVFFAPPEPAPVPEPQPEPEAAEVPVPAPALDEAAVTGLVAKAPLVVELQYEVLDLRHEVEALRQQIAALALKASEQPSELKTSQLSIVDEAGRMVAALSKDGTVTCRRIDLHPGPAASN